MAHTVLSKASKLRHSHQPITQILFHMQNLTRMVSTHRMAPPMYHMSQLGYVNRCCSPLYDQPSTHHTATHKQQTYVMNVILSAPAGAGMHASQQIPKIPTQLHSCWTCCMTHMTDTLLNPRCLWCLLHQTTWQRHDLTGSSSTWCWTIKLAGQNMLCKLSRRVNFNPPGVYMMTTSCVDFLLPQHTTAGIKFASCTITPHSSMHLQEESKATRRYRSGLCCLHQPR